MDLIGAAVGLLLSLFVFSYLLGDNVLFRFAIHLFIGVAAGLAAAVIFRNVIMPHVLVPLLSFSNPAGLAWVFLPFLFGVLMLAKLTKRFNVLGNIPLAYIIGVGAAAAVSGAVLGTLFPQINASAGMMNLNAFPGDPYLGGGFGAFFNRIIALVGTVTALAYFHFGSRSRSAGLLPNLGRWIDSIGRVGQIFIAVTFGVLFAGVYSAALAALVDRVYFFNQFFEAINQAF